MDPVIAARDARHIADGVAISIGPRLDADAAIELHDATLADEVRFVPIEHAEDARIRDAIDVADDAFAAAARGRHAGIRAEIIESPRRARSSDMARNAAQPPRHLDVDEWPQSAVDEQQGIASRGP